MALTRTALTGLVAAVLCVVGSCVIWLSGSRGAAPSAPEPEKAQEPVEVLRAWDGARARAWQTGDVPGLRALYVTGSPVGRRDAAMLQAYVERGLVVEGLTTQLLEVREVHVEPDRLVLDVTDRVHAGTVVGDDVRRVLPRDAPSRRRVTLRRGEGEWRVARVVHRGGRDER